MKPGRPRYETLSFLSNAPLKPRGNGRRNSEECRGCVLDAGCDHAGAFYDTLFYAGMVRKKNVLSVTMQSFAICCACTIVWYVCGYSLAFTEGNFFIGDLDQVFLKGIGIKTMHGSIPEMLFMIFQMTFAILTPALMCGAFAERMKFSALFLFMVLWSLFCYVRSVIGYGTGRLACFGGSA